MKKLYKTVTAAIVFSMLTVKLFAQLNGVYTINQTALPSASNFTSFTAFTASLNTGGVSGPVTVNVVTNTGPYNEQITINQFTGSSNVNTVTINGNSNTITFNGNSGAPHVIMLAGADYVFVNTLTITATNATNAWGVHLYNNSDNNKFTNCKIETPANLTATNQYPVTLSGSQTSATSLGSCGSNNIFTGCTINNGRYGVVMYGNTGSPFNTNNQVINCNINDFYQRGVMVYYQEGSIIRGNTFERLTRTNFTTTYVIFINYCPGVVGTMVEGNKIRRMFVGNPTNTNQIFGIYNQNSGATVGAETTIRNNVISDIVFNGDIYAIYNPGYDQERIYHNTIVIHDLTATSGYVYGIIDYGFNGIFIKNNVVSVNRSGSGVKYCLLMGSTSPVCNNNILYNSSPSGANIGYYNADFATLAAWQGAGSSNWDGASMGLNPNFNNPLTFDYTPTVAAMNNIGTPLGLATDVNGLARNLPAPDAGAFEFFNTQCTGTPGANSVTTPTYIVCPSAITNLGLANSYTVNGIAFQWQISTGSALGPYTPISGATVTALSQTLASSAFFNVSMYCVNGGSTITAAAGQVTVAGVTINTPPYFEGFEGIIGPEKLPNCSWSLSDPNRAHTTNGTVAWMSPRTGAAHAYHGTQNNGFGSPQYHYTNGLQLNAGVTYSASVWYLTPGYSTVSNFALEYGTTQSPTGLTTIAVVNNPGASQYTSLSNTFVVPTSGIYYVAIRSTDNYAYDFFAWDDLAITVPCDMGNNVANLAVTGPSVVCAGQIANFSASGVNSYTWVSGPSGQFANLYSPVINQTGVVTAVGINTLSGCTSTVNKPIIANPLPAMSIVGSVNSVCQGQPITLVAIGASANSYSWSSGTNSQAITVTPPVSTTYTVLGMNAFGCVGSAQLPVTVNPSPSITVNGSTVACEGERVTLTASGASTYTWTSLTSFNIGSQVIVSPMTSTSYMVTGTDVNGCVGSANRVLSIEICTGIGSQSSAENRMQVYPNPNNGTFTVKLANGLTKSVEVMDVTGRVILTGATTTDSIDMNISGLANGVYYVKVQSDNKVDVLKVVKQ